MGVFRQVFLALLVTIFGLTVVVVIRTFTLEARTIKAPECKPLDTDFISADKKLIERFQKGLQFSTVSTARHEYNASELTKFREFIYKNYPTLHSSPLVKHEVVAGYSLLYEVAGSDPTLKPFMLMGHLDVVPVPDPSIWDVPPFTGQIHDGFIYGRGTIDDKHTAMGILEAAEFLLTRKHKPRRTFYIALGHDEETGGYEGASAIGKLLEKRGVKLEYILDEGLTIIKGLVPGIKPPVALIGSSEKGSLTVKLTVEVEGGHSSMPLHESSIGIISKAIARLEENPHPSMFGTGPEKGTFEQIASHMVFPARVLMSNIWLFGPVIAKILSRAPATNAITRTTTAVTMINGGIKENVIAPVATAVVNHRLHPSDSVDEVFERDRQIINDRRVKIEKLDFFEPLPQSPYGDEDFGFQIIKTSILQVWGYTGAVVAPGTMIGNTDTRHYLKLCDNIYRFSPTFMVPEDLKRFHGVNERISPKNYEEAVNFFYHLMINSDSGRLPQKHSHDEH